MKKIKSLIDQFEQLQANSEDQGQAITKENLKNLKGGGGVFQYSFMRAGYVCRFCYKDNSD